MPVRPLQNGETSVNLDHTWVDARPSGAINLTLGDEIDQVIILSLRMLNVRGADCGDVTVHTPPQHPLLPQGEGWDEGSK